jgi:hypothetical protein
LNQPQDHPQRIRNKIHRVEEYLKLRESNDSSNDSSNDVSELKTFEFQSNEGEFNYGDDEYIYLITQAYTEEEAYHYFKKILDDIETNHREIHYENLLMNIREVQLGRGIVIVYDKWNC